MPTLDEVRRKVEADADRIRSLLSEVRSPDDVRRSVEESAKRWPSFRRAHVERMRKEMLSARRAGPASPLTRGDLWLPEDQERAEASARREFIRSIAEKNAKELGERIRDASKGDRELEAVVRSRLQLPPVPPEIAGLPDRSMAGEVGAGLVRGSARAIGAFSGTIPQVAATLAERAGLPGAEALKKYGGVMQAGAEALEKAFPPSRQVVEEGALPDRPSSIPRWLAARLSEQSVNLALAMVPGAALSRSGSAIARSASVPGAMSAGAVLEMDSAYRDSLASLVEAGMDADSARRHATDEALVYGAVAGLLDYFPARVILEPAGRRVLSKTLLAALAEGSTESAQEFSQELVRLYGGSAPQVASDLLERMAASGIIGGLTGGAASVAMSGVGRTATPKPVPAGPAKEVFRMVMDHSARKAQQDRAKHVEQPAPAAPPPAEPAPAGPVQEEPAPAEPAPAGPAPAATAPAAPVPAEPAAAPGETAPEEQKKTTKQLREELRAAGISRLPGSRGELALLSKMLPKPGSQWPERREIKGPVYSGRQSEIITGDGRTIPFTYVIAPLSDLIPTHDPTKQFSVNLEGDWNERPYHDKKTGEPSREMVRKIAASIRPAEIINDSPNPTTGPPITTNDLRVVGGNARTMALILAGQNKAAFDEYRKAVIRAAESYGVRSELVEQIPDPVLIRRIDADPGPRGELSRILNEPLQAGRTVEAQVVSRGSSVTPEVAERLSPVIGESTLDSALSGRSGFEIAMILKKAGAFSDAEMSSFLSGGELTPEGRTAVKNTLLGSVLPDSALIDEAPAHVKDKIVRSMGAFLTLRQASSRPGSDLDIDSIVGDAVRILATKKSMDSPSVRAVVEQGVLLDEPFLRNRRAVALAEALDELGPVKFADKMLSVKEMVSDAARENMLLGQERPLTPGEAFDESFGISAEPQTPPAPQPPAAGIVEAAPKRGKPPSGKTRKRTGLKKEPPPAPPTTPPPPAEAPRTPPAEEKKPSGAKKTPGMKKSGRKTAAGESAKKAAAEIASQNRIILMRAIPKTGVKVVRSGNTLTMTFRRPPTKNELLKLTFSGWSRKSGVVFTARAAEEPSHDTKNRKRVQGREPVGKKPGRPVQKQEGGGQTAGPGGALQGEVIESPTGETGAIDLSSMVGTIGRALSKFDRESPTILRIYDTYVRDLLHRVLAKGTPSARFVFRAAMRAVSETKGVLGEIHDVYDKAKRLTSGLTISNYRANMRLQELRWVNGAYAFSRLQEAIEKDEAYNTLTPEEKKIVDSIRLLTEITGRYNELDGHMQYDEKTKEWVPFQHTKGGRVFLREMTEEFIGVILEGPAHPAWDAVINAWADANSAASDSVDRSFRKIRRKMIAGDMDGAMRRFNTEFIRRYGSVPVAIRVGSDVLEVIHTHPRTYIDMFVNRWARRFGAIRVFGQNIGGSSKINKLRVLYRTENGGRDDEFVDLMRALHGMPVERPLFSPGTAASKAWRCANAIVTVARSMLLSATAPIQLGELVLSGRILSHGRFKDVAAAIARFVREPKSMLETLRLIGMVDQNVVNLVISRTRPGQSASRIFSDVWNRVWIHHYINEITEKFAAIVALEKVMRISRGEGDAADAFDLRTYYGFSPREADRIIREGFRPGEAAMILRRAPGLLSSTPVQPAEVTRASHNQFYRFLVPFRNWAESQLRYTAMTLDEFARTIRNADFTSERGRAKAFRDVGAAAMKTSKLLALTTAQGAMQLSIMAVLTGGLFALGQRWREGREHWLRFILLDMFGMAQFAGPYGAALRIITSDDRPAFDAAWRATMPGMLIAEATEAVMGLSVYEGMNGMERAAQFGRRFFTASKYTGTFSALLGFGDPGRDSIIAIKSFWRFYRRLPRRPSYLAIGEEEGMKFYKLMRRAYFRWRKGDDPIPFIEAALEVEGKHEESVRRSILSRRLLTRLNENELKEFRRQAGEKAYRLVEDHDFILETWAYNPEHRPAALGR